MYFDLTISNNKDFKHDPALEDDFGIDSNFSVDCFDLHNKYKLKVSVENEIECREELMEILNITEECDGDFYVKIGFDNTHFNKRLISYLLRNCNMTKIVCGGEYKVVDDGFIFKGKSLERKYTHFISFLVSMSDEVFSKIKTRTKINLTWQDKDREEIAKQIISIIISSYNTDYENDFSFDIGDPDVFCSYINFIVKDNKIITGSSFCNGPVSAYNYKKEK